MSGYPGAPRSGYGGAPPGAYPGYHGGAQPGGYGGAPPQGGGYNPGAVDPQIAQWFHAVDQDRLVSAWAKKF